MTKKKKSLLKESRDIVLIAILFGLLLRAFVIGAYRIPSKSMTPELLPGDFILSYKLPYGFSLPFTDYFYSYGSLPDRGDVVLFKNEEEMVFIKRVIGLPGDEVSIKNDLLMINGVQVRVSSSKKDSGLIEDVERIGNRVVKTLRLDNEEGEFFGPVTIEEGHIFVMGDNRDASEDSRYMGSIPIERVLGRAVTIWLSFDPGAETSILRKDRIFNTL